MKRPKFQRGQMVAIETNPDKNKTFFGGYIQPLPTHHFAQTLNEPISNIKDLLRVLESGHTSGVDEGGDYISSDTIGIVVDSFFRPPREYRFDEGDVIDDDDVIEFPDGWYYVVVFENKRFGFRECELRSL